MRTGTTHLHSHAVTVSLPDGSVKVRNLTSKSVETAEAHARTLYPTAVQISAVRTQCAVLWPEHCKSR